MGADEVRNLADGDSLPDDAELVFEASGAPAALGNVLRANACGGAVCGVAGDWEGLPTRAELAELGGSGEVLR